MTFSVFRPPYESQAVIVISSLPPSTPPSDPAQLQTSSQTHINTHRYCLSTRMPCSACLGFDRLFTCRPGSSSLIRNMCVNMCVRTEPAREQPSPVCLFAVLTCRWGGGRYVGAKEISTSQIRLINPRLKPLVEESC